MRQSPPPALVHADTSRLQTTKTDRFLDAARDEFIEHGIGRVGVADIARRAGVSRQTLYRACGDKDAIVSAVIGREVLQFASASAKRIGTLASPQDRLVEMFVSGVRECRDNPVVSALRHYDFEYLAAQVLSGDSRGRQSARTSMAMIVSGGEIPFSTAERIVEFAVRITSTLLISPTPLLPTNTDTHARQFAKDYLAPVVDAALSSSDHLVSRT